MVWSEKVTIDGLPYYYNEGTEEITWDKPEDLMTDKEKDDEAGQWVWVPHDFNLWQVGKIQSTDQDGSFVIEPRSGRVFTVPANKMYRFDDREVEVQFWPVKLAQLNRPEEDLVQMSLINEASIINNIRLRYEKDELYTWVGAAHSVLISVNPYKSLPLYGPKQIELYRNKPPNTHFKPHVYDIANNSYNALLFDNRDQSILISGESGAGKTVCTKQCLSFLAQVAGSEQSDIEEKILMANPLLEAFGNAQTIRNNNSSRFGKWIEVFFEPMGRKISSAKITNYLLEKSRLVNQAKNERNYHIFYQMTTDKLSMREYELEGPENYHYTNQSGLYKAHLIDDKAEFAQVKQAFDRLNFDDEEKEFVLSTTAAILHIGNCEFKEKLEKGSVSGSELKDPYPAELAAQLMGFDEEELAKVLSYRSITVRGVRSEIPLDPPSAATARDSFCMGVYSRLFDFLVFKINESLQGKTGKFIGILDIFGFEIFEQNSFEQLCINFANEKLQQQFNNTTFKEEEALYEQEGIPYTTIQFYDNKPVLDMIEKKRTGILPLLDDTAITPGGSDEKFMRRIEETHLGNGKFLKDAQRKRKDEFNFEIAHYAGVVKYNGEGFMQKNSDTLFNDMYELCSTRGSRLFAQIFPPITERKRQKSISGQFCAQLDELMKGLYQTESRYIRCVKPNAKQRPKQFNSFLCIDQLRYSGVFEAVEIRKQGYPFRCSFGKFACRYSCINRNHRYKSDAKDFQQRSREILESSKQNFADCVFGKSMVLFKTLEYSTLELLRSFALETIIPQMQKVMRGHLAREMRRRCLELDAALQQALNITNDLPLTNAAIEAVEPTLADFMQLFPGVLPLHYNQAIELKQKLDEWALLERTFQSLIIQDPNKVYYELGPAILKGLDLRGKQYPETASQTKILADSIHAKENCTLGLLDTESIACLAVLDLDRMLVVKNDAKKLKHTTDTISKIGSILSLSEKEIVKLEIEKAKEMNDEKRRIHREIHLFNLELDENRGTYSNILKYRKLKSATEYSKAARFGKQKKAETMMDHSIPLTIAPLTHIQQAKGLNKIVKNISKGVRQFMGDKELKGQSANEVAASIVKTINGTKNGITEEAYMQVIKQVHKNPDSNSKTKGFELLGVLLGSVIPEHDLHCTILVFVESQGYDINKYNAVWHDRRYGNEVRGLRASGVASLIQAVTTGDGTSKWALPEGEPSGPTV